MTDEDQMDDFLSNSRVSVSDKIVPIESRRISFWGFFVIVLLLFLLASVPYFLNGPIPRSPMAFVRIMHEFSTRA